MNLGFSQKINGVETLFVEKIIRGIDRMPNRQICVKEYHKKLTDIGYDFSTDVYWFGKSKIHSIRQDLKNRWKVGMKIHFVINNRQPNRLQFAPILEVQSIQKLTVMWVQSKFEGVKEPHVFIDGKELGPISIEFLAHNDGFKNTDEFFKYFNGDFEGKLIHWTNFKYD